MTKSQANKDEAVDDKLLTLPVNAGRAIVEAGAVIACPLLGTDRFIKFCRERGLSIDRKRLLRLERLGLFAPVFRVRTPKKDTPPFYIPVRKGNNWFTKKWAWDTSGIRLAYKVPDHKDQAQEGYYSIFQIDYLHIVLQEMTLQVQMDSIWIEMKSRVPTGRRMAKVGCSMQEVVWRACEHTSTAVAWRCYASSYPTVIFQRRRVTRERYRWAEATIRIIGSASTGLTGSGMTRFRIGARRQRSDYLE